MNTMHFETESISAELVQPYASISRRVVALFLDAVILAIPAAIANLMIPFLGGFIAWFFYAPIFESSSLRATPGKHLMGIQVTELSGRRLSLRAALIRNLMKLVSGAIMCLGYLMALFTKRKQALHDMLADSVVVYGRSEDSIADAWVESSRAVFRAGSNVINEKTSRPMTGEAIVAQLERLQSLREKGAIDETEFQAAKAKILGTAQA